MNTELIETVAEEFRVWLSSHPERVHAAADAIDAARSLDLPDSQRAAITDLSLLLAKVLGRLMWANPAGPLSTPIRVHWEHGQLWVNP